MLSFIHITKTTTWYNFRFKRYRLETRNTAPKHHVPSVRLCWCFDEFLKRTKTIYLSALPLRNGPALPRSFAFAMPLLYRSFVSYPFDLRLWVGFLARWRCKRYRFDVTSTGRDIASKSLSFRKMIHNASGRTGRSRGNCNSVAIWCTVHILVRLASVLRSTLRKE